MMMMGMLMMFKMKLLGKNIYSCINEVFPDCLQILRIFFYNVIILFILQNFSINQIQLGFFATF